MLPPDEYVVYEDLKNEVQVQITTPNEVAGTNDSSKATLDNYWLNEIKSQEDTARQIITICTLLLGASITLITGNTDRIVGMINDNTNFTRHVHADIIYNNFRDQDLYAYADNIINDIMKMMSIVMWSGLIIISFLFIWILALYAARKALKIEPITNKDHLSHIANIKHEHCMEATATIIIGTLLVTFFVVGLFLFTLKPTNLENVAILGIVANLGFIVTFTSGLILLTTILYSLTKKNAFQYLLEMLAKFFRMRNTE